MRSRRRRARLPATAPSAWSARLPVPLRPAEHAVARARHQRRASTNSPRRHRRPSSSCRSASSATTWKCMWDLDTEATRDRASARHRGRARADARGASGVRRGLVDLVLERINGTPDERPARASPTSAPGTTCAAPACCENVRAGFQAGAGGSGSVTETTVRVGTRASALALAQTRPIAEAIRTTFGVAAELVADHQRGGPQQGIAVHAGRHRRFRERAARGAPRRRVRPARALVQGSADRPVPSSCASAPSRAGPMPATRCARARADD